MQCTADTADTDTNIITVSWTRSKPQGGSTSDDFLTCYDAVLIILTAEADVSIKDGAGSVDT